ncbi:hypothetical protein [Actinomadura sp. WMMB 499]|uniref:hypothetical protein n=1 Tax=Actinomadura sp. WMMB 499 TaxID=1219491 RepID=UPI0012480B6A|nr:hypothetical protein [Actinomadura sp. WMMB 499]QFG22999.1 hypothetical protein F7P10_19625 [Actinomadura sp. WMMB 499]
MDDETLLRQQTKVAGFTDPHVRGRDDLAAAVYDGEFRYDGDVRTVALRERLRELFEEDPAARRILLVCDGVRVAVAVRESVHADPGTAGAVPAGDLGAGERAGLPGRSTQYRLLRFACARPGCAWDAHDSFYDERFRPSCPAPGHGPMEFAEVVR